MRKSQAISALINMEMDETPAMPAIRYCNCMYQNKSDQPGNPARSLGNLCIPARVDGDATVASLLPRTGSIPSESYPGDTYVQCRMSWATRAKAGCCKWMHGGGQVGHTQRHPQCLEDTGWPSKDRPCMTHSITHTHVKHSWSSAGS